MSMIVTKALRRALLFCFVILLISNITHAAIGVYNFSASKTASSAVDITYRLNCPGTVTIEILDSSNNVIHTMGPFEEASGLQTHLWQPNQAEVGSFKARICATCTQDGEPGKLVKLFGNSVTISLRGLAVDRFPDSPAYGTIYAADVRSKRIWAFYADGSPKNWQTEAANNNALPVNMTGSSSAPWGIAVDKLGNIYVANKAASSENTGVKIFDHRGDLLHHIFPNEKQSIYWIEGVATDQGLEIYETINNYVRATSVTNPAWSTIIGPLTGLDCEQLCFDASGDACYVACTGISSNDPDIKRCIRQADGSWIQDIGFNCGLSQLFGSGTAPASRYVTGVSCNSSGAVSTRLWVSLSSKPPVFGGNIIRVNLENLSAGPTVLSGPNQVNRMIAADAVGNLAMDTGTTAVTELWSHWGQYAVGGETNTDIRTTNSVVIGQSTQVQSISGVCECHAAPDDTLVQFDSQKPVTAVFDGCFYIQEPDRTCGIKVECDSPVEVGSLVKVSGKMGTKFGQRVIIEAQLLQ